MSTTVRFTGVTRRYGKGIALDDVDLSLQPGVTGLLGPNGAGKTTLLRLLSGERRPDEGSVWREDGLRVAVLDQQPVFAPGRTVQELLVVADPFLWARDELERLAPRLEEESVLERWMTLQRRFEDDGGYGWKVRSDRILSVLDLTRF